MRLKISAILLALLLPMIGWAMNPGDVLAKSSQKIASAKSITAKFSGSASGTLTVSGNRFSMVAGGMGVWYNGKDMWTYSKKAGETSLTTPTQAELLESNPMEVIKSYKSAFNATKVSEGAGKYTLKLTPKSKNNSVRSAVLVINTSTWMPASIDITFSNNQRMTVNINSISEGAALPASAFTYPQAKYPGVEVVDLR